MSVCLVVAACGSGEALGEPKVGGSPRPCDVVPSGVAYEEQSLPFTVPAGLMPDARFDGRAAQLHVHRVRPAYKHGKCPWVPTRAAILIHGRAATGPAVFDLKVTDPVHKVELSVQKALALAGIDTFAPSLLGYGRSTRFADGLDDPANASLPPYRSDGGCDYVACDVTFTPNPPDQQGQLLLDNPLGGQRRAHSSSVRFARVDTFVRDIRQVIDHAIAAAKPTDGKVVLVGYSAGGQRVGRTLYPDNPQLPGSAAYIAKVSRAVFLSSVFRIGPTEEPATVPAPTFPMTLTDLPSARGGFNMPPGRDAVCTGHIVPGSQDGLATQLLQEDGLGASWGNGGVIRSPTFSSYGWNDAIAGKLTTPSLVIHGLDEVGNPVDNWANGANIYAALTQVPNKVLVEVGCASHSMLAEGCDGPRCKPASGTPYGALPGHRFGGPHTTVKAALIEWIWSGTFNGAANGRFTVDESGVARPAGG